MTDNEQTLSLKVTEDAGEAVVEVTGELDPHTAEQLTELLQPLTDRDDISRITLDVGGVEFMDSSGLRSVLSANDALRGRGGHLVLRSPSDAVRRLLEITDLLNHLEVE